MQNEKFVGLSKLGMVDLLLKENGHNAAKCRACKKRKAHKVGEDCKVSK